MLIFHCIHRINYLQHQQYGPRPAHHHQGVAPLHLAGPESLRVVYQSLQNVTDEQEMDTVRLK